MREVAAFLAGLIVAFIGTVQLSIDNEDSQLQHYVTMGLLEFEGQMYRVVPLERWHTDHDEQDLMGTSKACIDKAH